MIEPESPFFMGIDGGGSTLRLVIVDTAMQVRATVQAASANPSGIGRDVAADRIQQGVQDVLERANLQPTQIAGAGIGIAGTSTPQYTTWLHDILWAVLPETTIHRSTDVEIALVGAHGRESGLLVLAGTGSVAYAIHPQGERLLIGGRGYLIGDDGSGYWLGLEALRCCFRYYDGLPDIPSALPAQVLSHLNLPSTPDIIAWLYGQHPTPVQEVAALAPIVLALADRGDSAAVDIVQRGAIALADLVHILKVRLNLPDTIPIAFAGGLLEHDTCLRRSLCDQLKLATVPQAQYSPVMGAALLAKLRH